LRIARASWIVALAFELGWIAGCETARLNCPACAEVDSSAPDPFAKGCSFPVSNLAPSADPSVLLLSGGGAHGAWGAGVLVGWKSQPGGRPKFRVVTGISTGALQAPLVFLDKDVELEELYTQTTNSQIYSWKWHAIFSNSLQSREPLKQRIYEKISDSDIRQIGATLDRELWVGTVNLDTSQFCPWNLSEVAKRAKDANLANDGEKEECYYRLFRDIIWAASGAPVVAPPVLIDGDYCDRLGTPLEEARSNGAMHVDGGARLRVFADETILEGARAPGSTAATAYVIMNGKLVLHEQCVVNALAPIAMRAAEIHMSEGVFGNLAYMEDQLTGYDLKLSRIPDGYCLDFDTGEFDPEKLSRLFKAGKDQWAGTGVWEDSIPPDRVKPWPADCPVFMKGCAAPTP
jgi:hypothetical protein